MCCTLPALCKLCQCFGVVATERGSVCMWLPHTSATLHCRVERRREEKKKWGLPTPIKASMMPLPPPSLHAGLDELARDKRLCGAAMKGLLTILHPPEALPAGHRLPECPSLSRPQSQHAPLPFSANPRHPPSLTMEPHTDCHVDDYKCCYEINGEREGETRVSALCVGVV